MMSLLHLRNLNYISTVLNGCVGCVNGAVLDAVRNSVRIEYETRWL